MATLLHLLPPTEAATTEVCLTLFYARPAASTAMATPVYDQLAAAVGTWELLRSDPDAASKNERRGLYQATQPPAGFVSLYFRAFASTVSLHTEVVQLILSAADSYATAWPRAAAWLASSLGNLLRPNQEHLLGYTLVYRANASSAATPDPAGSTLAPEVLAAAQAISEAGPQPGPAQVLAQQPQADLGWLLLLRYPEAQVPCLVYLALGMGQLPDLLADALYFGPGAVLPRQDVFVHKVLHQVQLLSHSYDAYDVQAVQPFKQSIAGLLRHVDNPQRETGQLDDLAQKLADLTLTDWDLDRLELSLQQQLNGFRRRFAVTDLTAIAHHQLAVLESYAQEAHTMVAQHQLVLENARVAISLVEVQESKHAASIQEKFNFSLAIGGFFVALYSALDIPLVQMLLGQLGCKELLAPNAPPTLAQYFTRLGVSVFLAAIAGVVYWGIKQANAKKRAARVRNA